MSMERDFVNSRTRMLRARASLRRLVAPALVACAALMGGCSGNAHIDVANNQTADPATVDFPIFYVKRTIPPASDDLRLLRAAVKPTTDQLVVPKADVYMRKSASPSADELNISGRITGTDTYDIKDVYAESKGNGFDVKALRTIIRLRKQDPNERQEEESILETYMSALGMLSQPMAAYNDESAA